MSANRTARRAEDFVHGRRESAGRGHAAEARAVAASGDAVPGPPLGAEPAAVLDGTFVKVQPHEHPLPLACEVSVYFQDYHRSSSKLGRFAKVVGIDREGGEYLLMLDDFECVAVPMRRVEWRKSAT